GAVGEDDLLDAAVGIGVAADKERLLAEELLVDAEDIAGAVDRDDEVEAVAGEGEVARCVMGEADDVGRMGAERGLVVVDDVVTEVAADDIDVGAAAALGGLVAGAEIE